MFPKQLQVPSKEQGQWRLCLIKRMLVLGWYNSCAMFVEGAFYFSWFPSAPSPVIFQCQKSQCLFLDGRYLSSTFLSRRLSKRHACTISIETRARLRGTVVPCVNVWWVQRNATWKVSCRETNLFPIDQQIHHTWYSMIVWNSPCRLCTHV